MPAQPTWPPPPTTPDLMAAHDEFLTTLVCAPVTKPPLSRLHLIRSLHQTTGMDLRQCLAVINSFCDRHGIFPQRRGLRIWLPLFLSLSQFALLGILIVSEIFVRREMASAPTRMARHFIYKEQLAYHDLFLCFFFVILAATLINRVSTTKRIHREAQEAREKISS